MQQRARAVKMCRNVVFDLGGVVVDWQPERLVAAAAQDESTRARLRREVFAHREWLELDRGTLGHAEAIARFAARTGLTQSAIAALLARVAPSLTPKADTLALVRALRAAGHGLYFLSNMAETSVDHLEREHEFWALFDGGVVSCRVGLLKPEPEIYRCLLDRYALRASDTIFIDDLQANVDAARALGITGITFIDAQSCARALRDVAGLRF